MATQIINNGSSLKIVTNEVPRYVLKHQVYEVVVIRDTIIKIDIGQGALYNIFIDQLDVNEPASVSVDDLRDKIAVMLQSSDAQGLATELKQIEGNTEIVNIRNSVSDMKDKINSLNDKLFFEPRIVDESNNNVVYKGFADPGANQGQPVWAILKITNNKGVLTYQWADGNKNFDNIWEIHKFLIYS